MNFYVDMVKHIRTRWAPYQLEQRQMELLRQKNKGQPVLPSRQHLWVHHCCVEEGWKFVLWWSPNHRVVWPCVYRKTIELVFASQSKVQDKEHGKRSSSTKTKQEIFSPSPKAEESRDLWLVIQQQQGDACREQIISEKGKHRESCSQCRHRWQMNTAPPHTTPSQNHYARNKPCSQLLKYHISCPGGCRKARFALSH